LIGDADSIGRSLNYFKLFFAPAEANAGFVQFSISLSGHAINQGAGLFVQLAFSEIFDFQFFFCHRLNLNCGSRK